MAGRIRHNNRVRVVYSGIRVEGCLRIQCFATAAASGPPEILPGTTGHGVSFHSSSWVVNLVGGGAAWNSHAFRVPGSQASTGILFDCTGVFTPVPFLWKEMVREKQRLPETAPPLTMGISVISPGNFEFPGDVFQRFREEGVHSLNHSGKKRIVCGPNQRIVKLQIVSPAAFR